jgi:hypothetical protein
MMTTCTICNAEFTPTRSATYCSDKCRQKAHRQRHAKPKTPSKTALVVENLRCEALATITGLSDKEFRAAERIARAEAFLQGPEAYRRHLADISIQKALKTYIERSDREQQRRAEWDALTPEQQRQREKQREAHAVTRIRREAWRAQRRNK